MRVFIAGASGVIGRWLVPLLLARGDTVGAFAPSAASGRFPPHPRLTPIAGDLLAPETPARLPALLDGVEAVVHIATAIPRDLAAPEGWERTARLRTNGVRVLLDASLAAGVGCYLQQSIVMAYPDGGDRWLDESTPFDPAPARAAVVGPVAAMEGMVRATDPARLRWCILRGGRLVGPGTFQDDLLQDLRTGRAVVAGEGRSYRSLVHAADFARAIALALAAAPAGATFNVADEPIRDGEYLDRLAALVGAPPPPRDPSRVPEPSRRCSSAAIRAALGWAPLQGIWPARP